MNDIEKIIEDIKTMISKNEKQHYLLNLRYIKIKLENSDLRSHFYHSDKGEEKVIYLYDGLNHSKETSIYYYRLLGELKDNLDDVLLRKELGEKSFLKYNKRLKLYLFLVSTFLLICMILNLQN